MNLIPNEGRKEFIEVQFPCAKTVEFIILVPKKEGRFSFVAFIRRDFYE